MTGPCGARSAGNRAREAQGGRESPGGGPTAREPLDELAGQSPALAEAAVEVMMEGNHREMSDSSL